MWLWTLRKRDLFVYENTFGRLSESRDYLRSWRVKLYITHGYYDLMYSHLIRLINSLKSYEFLYLFLENSIIIRYVWYIILLIQIQYDMPFWEIWNCFDNSYESWETNWSEDLFGRTSPSVRMFVMTFCDLLRLRLTLRLRISRTKFFFLEGKKL